MEYSVRPATIEDCATMVQQLLVMFEECGHNSYSIVKGANFIETKVRQKQAWMLVCDSGSGEIVIGSMAIDLYSPWWTENYQAMDHWVFVLPDWRTRSAWQTLVDYAVQWAAETGVPLYLGLHVRGAERKRKLMARTMEECLAVYQTNYAGGEFRPAQAGD